MAECYLDTEDYKQSLACVELQLYHWGENDPEALFIYAKALTGVGRNHDAIEALERCRDLWGELILTTGDLVHLHPLVQDGSLRTIKNAIIQV